MKSYPVFILAGLALAGSAGAVAALQTHDEGASDAVLLSRARVSITQAITTAETRTNGRAIEVSLELEKGQPAWIVSTVTANGGMSAQINAVTGAVDEIGADDEDGHDGGHEGHDEKDAD